MLLSMGVVRVCYRHPLPVLLSLSGCQWKLIAVAARSGAAGSSVLKDRKVRPVNGPVSVSSASPAPASLCFCLALHTHPHPHHWWHTHLISQFFIPFPQSIIVNHLFSFWPSVSCHIHLSWPRARLWPSVNKELTKREQTSSLTFV